MVRRIAGPDSFPPAASFGPTTARPSSSPADSFAPPEDPTARRLRYGAAFDRIVDRVYDVKDPLAEYDALEKDLVLGPQRSERGALVDRLDRAADNLRRAHKLFLAAEVEYENFKAESTIAFASHRAAATRELEVERSGKEKSKMITNDDVESKIAILFTDDYVAHKHRATRMKGMYEHVKKLVEVWQIRCSTIQTQINGIR